MSKLTLKYILAKILMVYFKILIFFYIVILIIIEFKQFLLDLKIKKYLKQLVNIVQGFS